MELISTARRIAMGIGGLALALSLAAQAQDTPAQEPPPAEPPSETTAAPAEVTTPAPVDAPVPAADTPREIPADAPAETPAETPAEAPAAAPAEAPAAPAPTAPVERSEMAPLVTTHALILDFADGASRAIAVGERGQILVSESRSDWRQVENVPTRATLTAVATVGEAAWAVGHEGTILHSADGGLTWAVQRADPWHPPRDDEEFNPRQGVPLLDVLMLDAQRGFAVGAYSLMLRTADGGATWEEVDVNGHGNAEQSAPAQAEAPATGDDENWTFNQEDLELEEESDPHFNAIARTGDGSLFIVAERGAAFRSRDDGATWERLQLPYEGSMFGVIGYEGQRVLAFGMRGHALESNDLGNTWTELQTGTGLSLMGGAALPDGGAAMVGANGIVLIRPGAGAPITAHTFQTKAKETPVLSGVLPQSASALVVAGEKGIGQFKSQ